MGSSFQDDAKGRAARSVAKDARRMRSRLLRAAGGVERQEVEESGGDAEVIAVAKAMAILPAGIRAKVEVVVSQKMSQSARETAFAMRHGDLLVDVMQVVVKYGTVEHAMEFARFVNAASKGQIGELRKMKRARSGRAELGEWVSVRVPSPFELLLAKELAEKLEKKDALLVRMLMEGYSWRFIARVLGISRGGLRKRQESLIRAVKEVEVPQERGGKRAS